ncbi:hypothetical protein BDQ12DRAFT_766263 [Crucibulum laeve]|uniref:DUF6533 domain-containing protein n=1 Tax=Crucibulum laeve TaxID=68775 RepID=A0A5C3LLR0_9AGAR|nr:hypothetical protein BDQ12DRAFT_766263 [Crucibulum laeve]
MDPSPFDSHALATAALHLRAAKYFQIASFVMLLYDHALTFSEEVERVWKQRITGASVLFLINRYATPLQFIVVIDAFHDPNWTLNVSITLRLQNKFHANSFIFSRGCILTGPGILYPAAWLSPLVIDCCIFILTLWQTCAYIRRSNGAPIIRVFLRDGTMHFMAVCMANLMNILIYFLIPFEDLKPIGASFSLLLTATLTSRLILNLRSFSTTEFGTTSKGEYQGKSGTQTFMENVVGNLGNDMDIFVDMRSETSAKSNVLPLVDIRSIPRHS